MMSMRTFLILITCIVAMSSCRKDNEQDLYGDSECLPENVSFSNDIQPIISNSCAVVGCHVQGGLGNGLFENYDQVKTKVDNGALMDRVVVAQDMPPTASLSACQIEFVRQWILEGALDN